MGSTPLLLNWELVTSLHRRRVLSQIGSIPALRLGVCSQPLCSLEIKGVHRSFRCSGGGWSRAGLRERMQLAQKACRISRAPGDLLEPGKCCTFRVSYANLQLMSQTGPAMQTSDSCFCFASEVLDPSPLSASEGSECFLPPSQPTWPKKRSGWSSHQHPLGWLFPPSPLPAPSVGERGEQGFGSRAKGGDSVTRRRQPHCPTVP